jgi:hypothetical protein
MTQRTNARVAGFAFLFYIAVGITQMVLSGPIRADDTAAHLALVARHAWRMRVNIVLTLVICATAIVLAAALYALTRDEDRNVAVLGLAFRVGEGVLAALGALSSLAVLWLATDAAQVQATTTLAELLIQIQGWNVTIIATFFALGSTAFSWLLLRGRLIPVPLAWIGVVASIILVIGLPLRLVDAIGGTVTQLMWLPMAAFEIPLGFWLLIRGVRPATAPA